MTEEQKQYLSKDKYEELEMEIRNLKEYDIPSIAKRIDEAKQLGDLSENAEYHAARDDMAWAQTRVKEIENILNTSEVIPSDGGTTGGRATVGSTVRARTDKFEREFVIVGAQEADPLSGRISNESPLGRAFLGAKEGDEVEVDIPAGVQIYKILEVK